MLVLEDRASEDSGGDDEGGDCLPQIGTNRGTGDVVGTLVSEQYASPRSARRSDQTQGTLPSSPRTPVERKLASYQLPSLALVRTSVRAHGLLARLQRPSAQSCVN
jgi:hypothetical protein